MAFEAPKFLPIFEGEDDDEEEQVAIPAIKRPPFHKDLKEGVVDRAQAEPEKEKVVRKWSKTNNVGDTSFEASLHALADLFRTVFRSIEIGLKVAPLLFVSPMAFSGTAPEWVTGVWWDGVVISLRSLGGSFIKVAQWASTRPDMFPDEVIAKLMTLQDRAPAHHWRESEKALAESFGGWEKYSDQVLYLYAEPISSGSVAQVHRMVLKDGREVAAKVMHPGAREMMKRDMSLLKTGAWLMSCLPGAEYLSLEEGAQQFSVNMMLQLDLRREAENLNKFNVNVREWGTRAVAVHFPELLHCMTPDTLVMSYERGIPMGQYVKLQRPKKERGELAAVGIDSFLRMMFQNFVHADLHPGNMLVRTGAGGNLELVCLDVGLVCELSPKDYANFIDLFRSVVTKNPRQGAELLLLRAHQQNCSDPELFKAEMCAIMEAVFDGPSRDIRVGVVLGDIFSCVRRHRVSLDPAFTTMAVSMVLVEGLGKELDPDAQLIEYAIPYFASFDLRRRWNRFVGRRWPSFRVSKKKNDAL